MNRELLLHIYSENRLMLIVVAALSVLLFAVFYIAAGVNGNITITRAKYKEKHQAVLLQNPVDVATAYKQGGEGLSILKARIPARSEFPNILTQLVDLAASNKVSLGSISYKPQKSVMKGITTYTLSSSAGGGYSALKRFLSELQGLNGVSTVESVVITNNDPFEVRANMDFELSVHLRESAK